jgi:hypothetical protein
MRTTATSTAFWLIVAALVAIGVLALLIGGHPVATIFSYRGM